MLARLGNVIYWAANLFVGLLLAVFLAAYFFSAGSMAQTQPGGTLAYLALYAVPIWLVGRAIKYVLAGR